MGFGNRSKKVLRKPAIPCALLGLRESRRGAEAATARRNQRSRDGVGIGALLALPAFLEILTPAAGHVADKTGSLQKPFKPQAETRRSESILNPLTRHLSASRCLVLSSVFRYKSHPSTNSYLCPKHLARHYWPVNASRMEDSFLSLGQNELKTRPLTNNRIPKDLPSGHS